VELLSRTRLAGDVMVHRGMPEHGPWWKLGRDLVLLAAGAVVFSALFILGDLLFYGRVNW
jgi:hypothetical protein